MNAGLHPDEVSNVVLEVHVERDKKIDGLLLAAIEAREELFEEGSLRVTLQVGRKIVRESGLILEGIRLRRRFEKELKRIVNGHLSHELDLRFQMISPVEKNKTSQVVAERILLPVDEMLGGLDF